MLATTGTKRMLLEWVSLRFVVVGIIASVEACPKFLIRKNLIRLVNSGHLLLSFFFGNTLRSGFIRVVFFSQLAISAFDCSVVCVTANTKDFVVVLLLGSFQQDMRFL